MQKFNIVLLLTAIFIGYGQAKALTVWPDTAQNKCYGIYGSIVCPSKGQQLYGQDAQYQGQQPSYTKLDVNGSDLPESAGTWSMVLDNVTKLTWEVKTDDSTMHDRDNDYYWCDPGMESSGYCDSENNTETFINVLNSAKFGGYDDWRLPSIQELATLIYSESRDPAINTIYFPLTDTGYWSSTAKVGSSSYAWLSDFRDGGDVGYSSKSSTWGIRAVRGGLSTPVNHYQDNLNGTVTDRATQLMWQQETGTPPEEIALFRSVNWKDALAYIVSLNEKHFAGYSDWRLPNRNELQSLVDYSKADPAIDTDFFPDTPHMGHWTSTTWYGDNEYAWAISFGNASANSESYSRKTTASDNYVRAVRTYSAFTLSVGLTGNGDGTVASIPAGISCGTNCSQTYESGTKVSLTAIAGNDSIFTGWTGVCSGTGSCTFTMNQSISVVASFRNPSLTTLIPTYLLLLNPYD